MLDILKNKLLIILLLFFIITASMFNNVLAANEDIIYFHNNCSDKDIAVKLPAGYGEDYTKYAVFTFRTDYYNYYIFAFSNKPFYYNDSSFHSEDNSVFYYKQLYFSISDSSSSASNFDFSGYRITDKYFLSTGGGYGSSSLVPYGNASSPISYSNHVIFKDETKTEEVFYPAPQEKVELMKAIQPQEIPQLIIQIILVVLPIFLGIFGVLLVLYLIKSKNLLQL